MEVPAETSHRASIVLPDDAALKAIAEDVEAENGDRFFSSMARNLALALGVQYAFVTRLSDDGTHFEALASWECDHFGGNVELPPRGSALRECATRADRPLSGGSVPATSRLPFADRVGAQSCRGVPCSTRKAGFSVMSRLSMTSRCLTVRAVSC
jgi:hypothetical protein